jgi:aromatic ring-opening dioxygenase catalytic subunit (LigB family)
MRRLPTLYLPHGGGPWPYCDLGPLGDPAGYASLRAYLEALGERFSPARGVVAVVCISAHWEEALPTVMSGSHPPLLFDYVGFPAEAYRVTWPAPGAPAVAEQLLALLEKAGLRGTVEASRGFDHGAFVPLQVAYPAAQVPTLQLSLVAGLDPLLHLALGRALAPLREHGVLLVGSGMSYHDLRGLLSGRGGPASERFDRWLRDAVTSPQVVRDQRLASWADSPAGRLAHPREEHLLPLHVVAGAALEDPGRVAWSGSLLGARVSAVHFGDPV